MNVTVLTASIPERKAMLAEAMASVDAQTYPAKAHLIGIDEERVGAPAILNKLLERVQTEYVMVLDDDDLLDSNHLATLVEHVPGAQVVYSYCRCEGRQFGNYNRPFDRDRLEQFSVVAHTALVRADRVRAVGGWRNVRGYDWDLWRRLSADGAEFRAIPQVTWVYRLLGGNQSWDGTSAMPGVDA